MRVRNFKPFNCNNCEVTTERTSPNQKYCSICSPLMEVKYNHTRLRIHVDPTRKVISREYQNQVLIENNKKRAKYPNGVTTKVCPWCKEEKSLSEFNVRHTRGNAPTNLCKKCAVISKYDLKKEDYQLLQDKQGGLCAICLELKPLLIDHDHVTGSVRGLLCAACNSALGGFGDNRIYILAAAQYLGGY